LYFLFQLFSVLIFLSFILSNILKRYCYVFSDAFFFF
jgi:hypothetical protein